MLHSFSQLNKQRRNYDLKIEERLRPLRENSGLNKYNFDLKYFNVNYLHVSQT